MVACLGGIHWKGFDYVADKCSQITAVHLYEWTNDGLLRLVNGQSPPFLGPFRLLHLLVRVLHVIPLSAVR